jgi:hypothetical protein
MQDTTTPTTCPTCDRPSVGRAFPASASYHRCSLGHVWADCF